MPPLIRSLLMILTPWQPLRPLSIFAVLNQGQPWLGCSDASLGFLLKHVEDEDSAHEAHRKHCPISASLPILDYFQYTCRPKPLQRLGLFVLPADLGQVQRIPENVHYVFRKRQ